MSIQLDAPTSSGPPAASLDEVGSKIKVGVYNVSDYHQRNFDTGEKEYWEGDLSKPKMGKVVSAVVIAAKDVSVPDGDNSSRPAAAGDLVSFWCEGGKWFAYRDAVKAAKGINVGDVMTWERTEDDPPKKRGHNPKKNYAVTLRRPTAEDGDLADRCAQLYNDAQNRPSLDQPAGAPSADDLF